IRSIIGVLEKLGDFEKALELTNSWLKAHQQGDLALFDVISLKSRLLRRQGRFREALRFSEVAAKGGTQESLEEAVPTLIDLGRVDSALELAKGILNRYEGDSSAALVARLLWMLGQDEEATRLLTSSENRRSSAAWGSKFSAAFEEAFSRTDKARAEGALLKLAQAPGVLPLSLVWFLEHLTKNGYAPVALKICKQL